jgi:hypothetical protein
MKNVIACVFPDTLPDEGLLFPLVQVFGQLVYLQAVENEPLEAKLSTPFIEQLLQQGTLRMFTPVPLGGQRERFLALTGDMQKRGGDYISQLSMLTLAGLNRRERPETKNAILSALLHSSKIDSRKEEEELLLWQARLVLKLGEFFDAEQAELNEALRNIAGRQDDLLAELREETDNPFSLTASLQDSDQKTDGILQHRLKAWSRLFFHAPSPVQPQVFITRHETVIDILQEVFEKNYRQSAWQIASLELPEHDPMAGLSPLPQLIRQGSKLEAALKTLNTTEALAFSQAEGLTNLFTECAADWSQALATRYPAEQHGRCTLDLFLFPEISPRQLLLESFIGSNPATGDTSQGTCAGALVGLLKRDNP